jgi:hypothetical protein
MSAAIHIPQLTAEWRDFLNQSDEGYKQASENYDSASDSIKQLYSNEAACKADEHTINRLSTLDCFGKFVSIFNADSGILAWIGRQICKIWAKFNTECITQKSNHSKITALTNKLNSFKKGLEQWKHTSAALEQAIAKARKVWEPIIDLFGGITQLKEKTTFCGNSVPITNCNRSISIPSEQLLYSYPRGCILRGRLENGTYFLAFRGQAKSSENVTATDVQFLHLNGYEWKRISGPRIAMEGQHLTDALGRKHEKIFTILRSVCIRIAKYQAENKIKAVDYTTANDEIHEKSEEDSRSALPEDALPLNFCEQACATYFPESLVTPEPFPGASGITITPYAK